MLHTNWTTRFAVLVGLITSPLAAQSPIMPTAKSTATFTQVKSHVGEWDARQDGVQIRESYPPPANGSALMAETRAANEPAMITMFTVDGEHLIATHYCVAGNQPQMVASVLDDLQRGVTFTLARVTG